MADQQLDPQPWDLALDTTFDFRSPNDPHTTSAGSSASASGSLSPPGYHISNNTTAAPGPDSSATATSGTFNDFNDTPAWADPSQFTPPLGPNDSDPLDALNLNLFPDNWNVPTASFPSQPLQYRSRTDALHQSHTGQNLFFNSGFPNAPGVDSSGGPPPRPGPTGFGMPTLTPAQQEQLRNIAMPAHLQYQSPKSEPSQLSPQSSNGEGPKGASPQDSTKHGRKRKSSADEDDMDDEDDEDGSHPVKKTAHNMIEKRYRTNLNDKIAALRDSVPSLRVLSKSARGEDTTGDREELHGLTPAHKLNKATVLSKATEYIRHLEKRNTRLNEENHSMQQRISAFEKLFMANAMNGNMSPIQPQGGMSFVQDPAQFMGTPGANPRALDSQGMIPVPDDMKRIINAQMASGRHYAVPQQQNPAIMRQQQIQHQQQQMQNNRWQTAPFYPKMMIGALGGLMIVGMLSGSEESTDTPQGRGLSAIPLQLLFAVVPRSYISLAGQQYSTIHIGSHLYKLLLFGLMLWAFMPSLFAPRSPKTKTHISSSALKAVPSLASPINVRRQAWLTAIQTVWVPRHNFFLEAAALILKMMKLSLRNTIGVHGYQMLTGLTEEQETARVKAWTIALDAQLAGGDVEINKTRLTLTLLASRTLPDTPLRLMLNALHIRVLFWQLGKPGLHNILAAKLARSQWNEARQLNRLNNSLRRTEPTSPDDEIPDHLAVLLGQDCDDILNDDIVQRAHNLAFNRVTTQDIGADVDGMNAVVEDPAVRSPMDAVAAWWSSLMLQRVLCASLVKGLDDEQMATMADDINTAVKVAPIGSNAQLRALVAKAVVFDEKRGANIAAVMKALGPSLNPDKHPQYSSVVPPLIDAPLSSITPDPDVQLALRCAMAIAHLQRYEVPPHSALTIVDTILPGSTEGLSLLGCTAAFQLMERLHSHPNAAEACASSLERLAGTLRIWIGSEEGDRPGLDRDIRQKMVKRCLNVTKSLIGMDQGYATMSEGESESEPESCELVD